MAERKFLDFDGLSTYDGKIKGKILSEDTKTLQEAKDYADSLSSNYDASGTAQSLVNSLKNGQVETNKNNIETLKSNIGTLGNLGTSSKTDLVSSINEVLTAIGTGGTDAVVTIETSPVTEGSFKSYILKQGGVTIGTIDIPKDLVVTSGVVETNPLGQDPGTYIVLTIANQEDKLYINVGKLVDIYTVEQNAIKIQLKITDHEISATIVAGSITSTELATNAVTTVKIADGNITKSKLEISIQNSLEKADNAIQSIEEGSINGSVSVDGSDVLVHGLGSAAYVEKETFDSAGTASNLVSALESGQVTTNKNDITSIKSRLDLLEGNTYIPITEEEISALFS